MSTVPTTPNMAPQYDKVLLRKAKVIERCVARAREEYALSNGNFFNDLTRQDAAILNLQRACEACLDMAQRIISKQGWGVPETSKDLFLVLQRQSAISPSLSTTLSHMVGFRNIAVHDYEDLNMNIVESIIQHECSDLLAFSEQMLKQFFETKHPITKDF
jgi:uncharacterized protein YutE (UPF0331/DUF86 family)